MRDQDAVNFSLTIFFTALYAVLVVIFAPISFQVIQVRVADALLPLSILFGWPVIIGTTIGAFISNFFGGLGFIDILGGASANFIATYIAWKIGQRQFKGIWIIAVIFEIFSVAFIVGFYLSYLFRINFIICFLSILIGSVVSIGLIGYLLLLALSRHGVLQTLESKGIKSYIKREV